MSTQTIFTFNEDIDDKCTYCHQTNATASHIRWDCSFFEKDRQEADADIAKIPSKYLIECIRCGIGPALKTNRKATYWGADVDPNEDEHVQKILGIDHTLDRPGKDAQETEDRQEAIKIIEDGKLRNLNARQLMLHHKGSHGSGSNPTFPSKKDIEEQMRGLNDNCMV